MADEPDDEINLDFGKIWPFGKKKKEQSQPDHSHKDHKTEEKKHEEHSEQIDEQTEHKHEEHSHTEHKHEEHAGHKKEDTEHKHEDRHIEHEKHAEHKHDTPKVGESQKRETKNEDDDSEINLGDIKGKFKGLFSSSKEDKEDDVSLDLKGIGNFVMQKRHWLFPIFCVLLIIAVSTYIRMLPGQMLYTDDWAKQSVEQMIRSDISSYVDQNTPRTLPDTSKAQMVDQEYQKAISQDEYTFKTGQYQGQKMSRSQQIQQTSDYFKSQYQDENGSMYMQDIDPYYWYRYAQNIVDHGYPGDILKDGRSFDTEQLAPNGRFIEPEDTFHPYSLAYLYYGMRIFDPKVTLRFAVMIYPVIVSALIAVLTFFIARKIAGDIAGLFAGLMLAVNSSFISRSLFGHGDSDTWVLFFSVLVTFLYLYALESKKTRNQVILAVLGGIAVAVYSRFWGGWWYIFDFMLAATGVYGLYLLIARRSSFKNFMSVVTNHEIIAATVVMGVFIVSSLVGVLFLSGPYYVEQPISSLVFTRIKEPVMSNLWPNVLTTVAELNEGDINGIISNVGGLFLFYIALLGIMLSMIKKKIDGRELMFIAISAAYWLFLLWIRNQFSQLMFLALLSAPIVARVVYASIKSEPVDMKIGALLIIWFIFTIYASTKGIRFVIMLVPAFSIAFGITLGFLFRQLHAWLTRDFKLDRTIAALVLVVLGATIFIFPTDVIGTTMGIARNDVPMVNDAWYNSLRAITADSNSTAIITSWWDFGHQFKEISERKVTFDGTTQGSPQAHWVGQILRTDDEDLAMGILRMLDCGGNNAFFELEKLNNDTILSEKIIYDTVKEDAKAAKRKLTKTYGLSDEQADNVMQYLNCPSPPEAYFIASDDMIGKSGVWAHFGSWNFERAYIWYNLKDKDETTAVQEMKTRFNYTQEQAQETYYQVQAIGSDSEANTWVAPWPSYMNILTCNQKGVCDPLNLDAGSGRTVSVLPSFNTTNFDVTFNVAGQEQRKPKVSSYLTETGVVEKSYSGNTLDWAASVIPEGDAYKMVVSSPELNASMFSRMFFMEGHSLHHFKPFSYQKSISGNEIYVYKVNWQGTSPTIKPELRVKTNIEQGDIVSFTYIGYLEDGTVFDSSNKTGNITKDSSPGGEPLTFTVGQNQIIPGLEREMIGMEKGEENTITVRPEDAYGTDPTANALGNKTLIFKIRIENIK